MAQSPDHPDLPFLEARTVNDDPMYTPGRRGKKPIYIVIHDMEYPEKPDAAEWTANYFHTGAGGRSVSSHYCADNNSIVQCVLLKDSAWTVGNREGNDEGINWELAGFASQTPDLWLDPFSKAMIDRIVPYIRSDAARFGIPLRQLTDAQVRAKQPGITSHWQLARVFGGSTHTDPGPNFPWNYLMTALLGLGVDDMYRFVVDRSEELGKQSVYQIDGTDVATGLGRLIKVQDFNYVQYLLDSKWATIGDIPNVNPTVWVVVKPGGDPSAPVDLDPVLDAIEGVSAQVEEVAAGAEDAAFRGAQRAENS